MSSAVCPYCRGVIEQGEPETVHCPGCGTPHHTDCFEENGGCTVFGCTAAPAAEPKLSISTPDLQGEIAPAAPPPTVTVAAPPPPFPTAPQQSIEPMERPPMFSSLGYGTPQPVPYPTPTPRPIQIPDPSAPAKSRTTFLLLGVILGGFGAHSFYAGSTKKGFVQLAITLFTFGFAGLMVWIWAVIDICTISTDSNGVPFRN